MKTPLILITYGISKKLCTWEEDGNMKLPVFSEPVLASEFVEDFKSNFKQLLAGKEELQTQVCMENRYASDMMQVIGMINPQVEVIYNSTPLSQDPEQVVARLAKHFTAGEVLINKKYSIQEAVQELNPKDQ